MPAEKLGDLFQRAWKRRRLLLPSQECFRAFDGGGDGAPGIFVDRFGAVAAIHLALESSESRAAARRALIEQAEQLTELWKVNTLVLRVHAAEASETAKNPVEVLYGNCPEAAVVHESDLAWLIRPLSQVNLGLFLDMREVRRLLKSTCQSQRVLNTFCFTGSLGVAAACGGACEVVQVDVSRSALEWAKQNLALQAQTMGEVRYIREDVGAFLEREGRRHAKGAPGYDTIILDPPVFGRSSKGSFVLERDLSALVQSSLTLLSPGGRLLLTSNLRSLTSRDLSAVIREHAGERGSFAELFPPRPDFTASSSESFAMRGVLWQDSHLPILPSVTGG